MKSSSIVALLLCALSLQAAQGDIGSAINSAINTVQNAVDTATDAVSDATSTAVDAVTNAVSTGTDAVESAVQTGLRTAEHTGKQTRCSASFAVQHACTLSARGGHWHHSWSAEQAVTCWLVWST